MILDDVSFPISARAVFDKVILLDWYDGFVEGAFLHSKSGLAFRFDLIAWGPCEKPRAFVVSPLPVEDFKEVVALIGKSTLPTWGNDEDRCDRILRHLAAPRIPEFVIVSDESFETLLGAKALNTSARQLLPPTFDGEPYLDNFDFWKEYVGVQ